MDAPKFTLDAYGRPLESPPRLRPKEILESWPENVCRAAEEMILRYGTPDEASQYRLAWHKRSPWVEIQLFPSGVFHEFPFHHEDILQHSVSAGISPDALRAVALYNPSVFFEMNRGVLSVRCCSEEANILSLNLACAVATNIVPPNRARNIHASAMSAFSKGLFPGLMKSFDYGQSLHLEGHA